MWGRWSYLALGGALVAILALSGCGSSSSTVSTGTSGASGASGVSGSAITKAAFIKQADQICAEANSAVDSLSAGTGSDQTFQVSQELDITRSELQSLQALTPPQENKATLNDFLTAVKNEVDALGRANTAVQSGADTSSADAELASAKQNAEQAATQYGMKDCGNAKSRHTQAGGATTAVPTTTTAVPTTTTPTTTTPVTPTTTTPAPAPAPAPPSGGTGGSPTGGTGGSSGGTGGSGGSNGGTGGSGGVTP